MNFQDSDRFETSLAKLVTLLGVASATDLIRTTEFELLGQQGPELLLGSTGLPADPQLLQAALVVRARLGRINDVIHALGILALLGRILEPGETLVAKPSLASGNDPERPFDIETDRRVAEFKFSEWKGSDAMRKRNTFKDFVNLALDESDRRRQLYVLGELPVRFLRESRSAASWALGRAPSFSQRFERRFGSLDIEIRDFVAEHAPPVQIVDALTTYPELFDGRRST